MAQATVFKRSATAAGANTDTVVFTPSAGVRYKLLFFYVNNEAAAQTAGMNFELRIGSNIVAICGFDVAAAPIGQQSKEAVISHEFIGDGVNAVQVRNLTALAASSNAAYTVGFDADYEP
jgi:hypothetical protein